MTGQEYRDAIAKLGLTQVEAGQFFCASERTARRWVHEGPPELVARLLQMMERRGMVPQDVDPEWRAS